MSNTNFGYRGFDKGQFERDRTQIQEKPYEPKPGEYAIRGTLYDEDNPGKSEFGKPSGFYAGMHSTDLNYSDPKDKQQSLSALNAEGDRIHKMEQLERQRQMQNIKPEYHEEKIRRAHELAQEKRRDLQLLESYDPWGKPGGGAPKGENRLVYAEHADKQLADSSKKKTYVEQFFGRQGGGAPLTNPDNGKLKTRLAADKDVMMPNVSRSNPNLDWETTPAKVVVHQDAKILRARADEEQQRREMERAQPIQPDNYNPFGKPGAGAPNPRDINASSRRAVDEKTRHYRETLDRQIAEKAEGVQGYNDEPTTAFDPWGKGVGMVIRDASGNVIRPHHQELQPKTKYRSFADNMGTEGGGAPTKARATDRAPPVREATDIFGNTPTRGPPRITQSEEQALREAHKEKKQYLRDMQSDIDERKRREKEERFNQTAPADFFPFGERSPTHLLDSIDHRRHRTDVIQLREHGLGVRPEAPEVRETLARALTEIQTGRDAAIEQRRQEDLELDRRHVESSLKWEGHGVGAPRRNNRGETTGRFALDTDLHPQPSLSPEQRRGYLTDLDRLAYEKAQLRDARRQLSAEERMKSDLMSGFGKPGNGAPLRTVDGEFINASSKMVPKNDTHLLNTSYVKY